MFNLGAGSRRALKPPMMRKNQRKKCRHQLDKKEGEV
jgi:hypothetical protein